VSPVRCLLLLLVVTLTSAAAPARAAAGDPREVAAAHYSRGIDLAKQGLYEAALEQFNHAYATSPHFAVLYNIGQAQIALGRPLAAIEALASYLRDGADKVPLSRREQVQAQIALLEAKLGELTISTERPGVAIRVDDRDIGRTPLFQPIRLAAGTHTITATPPDGTPIIRVVTLAEAERRRLELAFAGEATHAAATHDAATHDAAPPTATTAPAQAPTAIATPSAAAATLASPPVSATSPDAPAARVFTLRRAAYVSTAVGVAAAGAALGVYLWNRGRYDDWQAGQMTLQGLTPSSAAYRMQAFANNDLASSLTTANHAILGLSIAGGVLVATGTSLWLVDRRRERHTGQVSLSWTGSSAQLGWSGRW
jgi:tetratricopeptide (TPR) repeat protein